MASAQLLYKHRQHEKNSSIELEKIESGNGLQNIHKKTSDVSNSILCSSSYEIWLAVLLLTTSGGILGIIFSYF